MQMKPSIHSKHQTKSNAAFQTTIVHAAAIYFLGGESLFTAYAFQSDTNEVAFDLCFVTLLPAWTSRKQPCIQVQKCIRPLRQVQKRIIRLSEKRGACTFTDIYIRPCLVNQVTCNPFFYFPQFTWSGSTLSHFRLCNVCWYSVEETPRLSLPHAVHRKHNYHDLINESSKVITVITFEVHFCASHERQVILESLCMTSGVDLCLLG